MLIGEIDLLTVLLFAGTFVLFASLALAIDHYRGRARASFEQRLSRVGRRSNVTAPTTYASVRRHGVDEQSRWFERLLHRVVPSRKALAERLERTGYGITVPRYVLICGVTTIVSGAVVALMLSIPLALTCVAAIFTGVALPHLVVSRMIARRQQKFLEMLPDAIDLMVRSLKSGLSVGEAINNVGSTISEPVSGEFRRVTYDIQVGQTLDEALWAAAERLKLPDFNFLVVSLAVQRETGGNLAETLSNLSQILRKRRQMKIKVKAMSAEARTSAKIVGSLPFLMLAGLYFISPDYLMKLFDDPRGMILAIAGASGLVLGLLVMTKMARFEI